MRENRRQDELRVYEWKTEREGEKSLEWLAEMRFEFWVKQLFNETDKIT